MTRHGDGQDTGGDLLTRGGSADTGTVLLSDFILIKSDKRTVPV